MRPRVVRPRGKNRLYVSAVEEDAEPCGQAMADSRLVHLEFKGKLHVVQRLWGILLKVDYPLAGSRGYQGFRANVAARGKKEQS